MGTCGHCSGNCAGCSGCGGCLELTEVEVQLLRALGQIPFLPVARALGDDKPVYLEESGHSPEVYSMSLQLLEKRGLISMDYTGPLKGFDAAAYAAYPIQGSFALTAKGQQVVELLEIQGIG